MRMKRKIKCEKTISKYNYTGPIITYQNLAYNYLYTGVQRIAFRYTITPLTCRLFFFPFRRPVTVFYFSTIPPVYMHAVSMCISTVRQVV